MTISLGYISIVKIFSNPFIRQVYIEQNKRLRFITIYRPEDILDKKISKFPSVLPWYYRKVYIIVTH